VVGEIIAGRYVLEELVGTGGMSSVYRAHDRLLERNVALKILHDSYLDDESAVERFRREARSVAQLSHPNIVTVIDRGEEDGRLFIVFEYVPGENLKQYVDRKRRLSVREAVEIAVEVGRGLAFAHRQGIVHRDVKPQNVLLDGDGRPKVTDFGIARSLDVEKDVTLTGTVLGTSDYIAPEQASGRPVVAQTDVYSLGCVLFELLTGDVPFHGESFVAVAMRHIHEPPPSVLDRRPDVPMRVAGAVQRAMAKEPDDRFPSMDAFVVELDACLAELGETDTERTMIAAGPQVLRESRPHAARARRRVWPLAFLVAGLAILGVAAALVLLDEGVNPLEPGQAEPGKPVELAAVASYDPQGDDREEHPDEVPLATDGDPTTYWPTSTYEDFSALKEGVGVVLDAGEAVDLSELAVRSDTPGFTAEIRIGSSPGGPFDSVVSGPQEVGSRTTFEIDDATSRYWLVWITELDGRARINEVTAR
jgi:eukaryotic-like serine/threonine-protein kinase